MNLYNEILFTPDAAEQATLNTVETSTTYSMPTVDSNNPDTTISNPSGNLVLVKFGSAIDVTGTGALRVPPGETILLQHGDGGFGDAASAATEVNIAGRAAVVITRGVATAQQIFANR